MHSLDSSADPRRWTNVNVVGNAFSWLGGLVLSTLVGDAIWD
ncbi:hypothetical protein [Methanopyrus sp. KOL6]|nr:hypothetical protein [Methanopyrus sp. KOL6]